MFKGYLYEEKGTVIWRKAAYDRAFALNCPGGLLAGRVYDRGNLRYAPLI